MYHPVKLLDQVVNETLDDWQPLYISQNISVFSVSRTNTQQPLYYTTITFSKYASSYRIYSYDHKQHRML